VDSNLDPLAAAEYALKREVDRRRLSVGIRRESSDSLVIDLADESRQLWLGYLQDKGYFITWDREMPVTHFFELGEDGIREIISLLPAAQDEDRDSPRMIGCTLVEEMRATTPDVNTLSEAVDQSHASEAGLDVLATVATLKNHRRAIDRLRNLVMTQETVRHTERTYLELLSEHP
jgi:hypothetical protein